MHANSCDYVDIGLVLQKKSNHIDLSKMTGHMKRSITSLVLVQINN
jgi:hypothetical protein